MRSLRLLLLCGIAAAPFVARAGSRTLQTPTRFLAGNTTPLIAVFAGDFTADGKQDVLVADNGKIRVMPGTGTGMFGAAVVSDSGGFVPEGLADFNGDARPDLYLKGDGQIAVMQGAANGSFGAPVPIPSSAPAGQLVAGDFTGDGLRDLAFTSSTHEIVILAGDGQGGFPTSRVSPAGFTGIVTDAAAGDFDGDGRLDIGLITDSYPYVAWNSGTSFTLEIIFPGSYGHAAAAGDVNGDGLADLIVSSHDGTYVSFGKAARGLTAVRFPGRAYGGPVTVARLDGDSRSDILVGGTYATVLTHDGTAFRAPHFFDAGERPSRIAVADFTGDGKTDVVVVHDANGGTPRDFFSLIPGNGDGTLSANPVFDLIVALGTDGLGDQTFLWDVNGDAKPDIIASTSREEEIAVLFGRGDGTFDAPILTTLPDTADASLYDAGDLNGDGRRDVILWDPGSIVLPTRFHTLFAQANGSFVAGPAQTISNGIGAEADLRSILDYTGDGKADLLDTSGKILPGAGDGTFGPAIDTGINTWSKSLSVADVNGDGRPDLIVGSYSTLDTYLNGGAGTFAPAVTGPWSGIRCTADINGDGFADLLGSNVSLGDGAGHFTGSGFGIDLIHPCVVLDIDGDGKGDVANGAAIYFGTGAGTFDAAAQADGIDYGNYGSGPVLSTADFDGNGSPDLWLSGVEGLLKIVRTRTGGAGTTAPVVAVSTAPNPGPYPSYLQPRATAGGAGIKARGAVLFSYDSAPPSGLRLVDASDTATDAHPSIPAGTTTAITATFLGDESYGAGSASTTHSVERGPTTVTCKTDKSTYELGQMIIVFATFKGNYGGSPTGAITYKKGDTVIGSQPPSAGQGFSFIDPVLFPVGTHILTTSYAGDDNFLPSQSAPKTITITKVTPAMTLAITAGPLTDTQQVTLTASFPNQANATGSVAFSCFGQALGNVAVSNAQAVLTRTLPWGSGYCIAQYGGSDTYGEAVATLPVTVYHAAMPSAPLIIASALPDGQVSLVISPISGASLYSIYRSIDGAALTLHTISGSSTTLDYVGPATVAVYAAAASNGPGTATPIGPPDIVTFVTFTDDPLVASTTTIKAVHLTELQTAINAVRLAAGLTSTTFAAPTGTISAAHLTSLRQALTEARGALGLSTSITDPTITPGVTAIRAIHLQELRDAVK